jgi:hypothetical protein
MTFTSLRESSTVVLHKWIIAVRRVRPMTWLKVGGCVAVAVLCTAEIALRGEVEQRQVHARSMHARQVSDEPRGGRPNEVDRLIAQTHSGTCEERSKAAEALASVRNRKAVAALKRLAGSSFKDESAAPGIFSCSSRRAAQRALDQQGT